MSALANGWRLNIIYFISESKTRSLSIGGRTLFAIGALLILGLLWLVAATSGLMWTLGENKTIKSELAYSKQLLFDSQMKHDDGVLELMYQSPESTEPTTKTDATPESDDGQDAGNISQGEKEQNAG